MLSIMEAAAQGIVYLRQPGWAAAEDHFKIDIIDGRHGPWGHLYSPFNKECNGHDPVNVLLFEADVLKRWWIPHTGPLADSAEYKAQVAVFEGCLSRDRVAP